MGNVVRFYDNTESQILALTSSSVQWKNMAFYYPSDKDYFYRVVNGFMKKYGSGEGSVEGVGVKLNNRTIGGVKSLIELNDTLDIPINYEYNLLNLQVYGIINCYGEINILQ